MKANKGFTLIELLVVIEGELVCLFVAELFAMRGKNDLVLMFNVN